MNVIKIIMLFLIIGTVFAGEKTVSDKIRELKVINDRKDCEKNTENAKEVATKINLLVSEFLTIKTQMVSKIIKLTEIEYEINRLASEIENLKTV